MIDQALPPALSLIGLGGGCSYRSGGAGNRRNSMFGRSCIVTKLTVWSGGLGCARRILCGRIMGVVKRAWRGCSFVVVSAGRGGCSRQAPVAGHLQLATPRRELYRL